MSTSYPLHKIKVVLLENIHPDAVAAFEAAGFSVEHHTRAYNGDELLAVAGDAHIVGVRSKSNLTAEFIERADRLWAIGCFCIGTNQVALDVAAAGGQHAQESGICTAAPVGGPRMVRSSPSGPSRTPSSCRVVREIITMRPSPP